MLTTVRDHTFLPSALPPRPTVVDLGSHRGESAIELIERFGGQCHAAEASPALFAQIPQREGLHRHQMAIAGRDGELTFHISEQPDSSSIYERIGPRAPDVGVIDVKGLTLQSFLNHRTTVGGLAEGGHRGGRAAALSVPPRTKRFCASARSRSRSTTFSG